MFRGIMQVEPIPARVFALYNIVKNYNGIKKNELQKKIEPEISTGGTSYFSYIFSTAVELGIINANENNSIVVVKELNSIDDLRKEVCISLDKFSEGHFYKATKAVISMNEEALNDVITSNDYTNKIQEICKEKIDQKEMRGWRFWAKFLGFGYEQDMRFLPNAYVFLKTILKECKLEKDKEILIDDFLLKIEPYAKILFNTQDANTFNLAFSSGLRQLNANKEIELIYQNDQGKVKTLFKSSQYNPSMVTAIKYRGKD